MSESRVAVTHRNSVQSGTRSASNADAHPAFTVAGEAYITPTQASHVLVSAGISPLDTNRRLRDGVRAGRLRWLPVHAKAGLYSASDVEAEAERLTAR